MGFAWVFRSLFVSKVQGGVQRHDERAVIEITGGVDEAGYLF
jgi:hypothetical protein